MTEPDRRHLSFRQAEGLEPTPAPLTLGQINDEARALIWVVIYTSITESAHQDFQDEPLVLGEDWTNIMRAWWVRKHHRPVDEFINLYDHNLSTLKMTCLNWEMSFLFDFLVYALRHPLAPQTLEQSLSWAFRETRIAYRIDDKTIWPAATPEEAETLHRTLVDLSVAEYGGARSHLKQASSLLNGGDWAGSIRESIHAVESVATVIEPGAKTLSDALKKLKNADRMNINLKAGLERLYAYTSDEKGIRHAKAFEETSVDQADAVYMLGACAAFVSFLIARRAT